MKKTNTNQIRNNGERTDIMAFTFRGGLHIPDHKTATNHLPIKKLDGAAVHIYPVQQHIGVPLEPTVSVGDKVCVGDCIASSEAFVSAAVHSSISGTVTAIKPHPHPSGKSVMSIFVENDGEYTVSQSVQTKDPEKMTREEMLDVIRKAGIMGMGGAGFPTHVKLSPPPEKKITHIIVNGAECEPYLTSDHRSMLENPEMIIDGLKICMKILGLEKGYIGVETNKQNAVAALKKVKDSSIEIATLITKYPQGAEKQLINAITGRKVPNGGLPADVGVIVLNIDTVTHISQAFRTGMPVISRIVTMSGDCMGMPSNFEVRTGMPVSDLIEAAGGFKAEPEKLLMGGPMMGLALYTEDVPVIKTTSAILALSKAEANYDADTPCIRCGKCVEHCPMRLMPIYLNKYIREGNLEKAEKYGVMSCIECGICSYLCPGMQSPLNNIRVAKQQIAENRRKNDGK